MIKEVCTMGGTEKTPIRVLHAIGCFEVGGAQAMVINLLEALDRTQIQIDFVVDNPDRMEWAHRVEELGSRIHVLPKFKGNNVFQVRKAWDQFFTEHPEYKILHSHIRSYASLYLPVAKKHGVVTIVHSHSTSNGSGLTSLAKRALQYPLRFQADYFFGCSLEAGQWLFGKKAVESHRYHMLKNAIAVRQYRFDPQIRQQYRTLLDLGDRKTYIHIGRFHPAKNHMFLLESFARIAAKDPEVLLLLIGDGDLRDEIQAKIAQLGLQGYVRLLGTRDDIHKILQAADCFVFPSLWEGLPVSVVEAQASGIPCVISDRITQDVVLSDLVTCLPVDQGTACWEQALTQPMDRKDVTETIRDAGYDIETSARWLEEFYKKILK